MAQCKAMITGGRLQCSREALPHEVFCGTHIKVVMGARVVEEELFHVDPPTLSAIQQDYIDRGEKFISAAKPGIRHDPFMWQVFLLIELVDAIRSLDETLESYRAERRNG